jgi:hypothetical protein
LFFYWLFYAAKVFEGELLPKGDSVYEYEIDYNTRIYRLAMDPTNRYVQHILATGAAFPLNVPVGMIGNFDSTQPYNDSQDNVNIRFQCIGMDFNDPILVHEFNKVVHLFNPGMKPSVRNQHYIQIPYEVIGFFNMRGYPQIDPTTMELQWWIPYRMFQSYLTQLQYFADLKGLPNFVSEIQQRREEEINAT